MATTAPAPVLTSENGQSYPTDSPPIAGEPKNQPPFTDPTGTPPPPPPAPPDGSGLMTIQTPDQLGNVATTEINNEISGAVAPLQSQYDSLTGSEDKARSALQTMFGSINPYVAQGAQNVQQSYDAAEQSQQNIFAAATQRLNQLKQSQAQKAQALAQEMGGPVALSEFTAGIDENSQSLANLGAGAQLHTLGYAQAGVQEANAWQARVMPLIQTEQQAKVQSYFEDQKKTIQDQITALKSSASSKIEQRKNDLIASERTFALQKTQEALDKLKANRDWAATKQTLANDAKRIAQSDREFALQQAQTTGTYKGKPTLAAQSLTNQEKQQAIQLGLSNKDYQLRKQQLNATTTANNQRIKMAQAQTYGQLLDAATAPGVGKSVTETHEVPVSELQALKNHSAFVTKRDKKGNPIAYAMLVKTVTPIQTSAPITNPGALVDFLTAHQVPKATAIRMVRQKMRIPNWVYGEGDPNGAVGDQGRTMPGGITRPG